MAPSQRQIEEREARKQRILDWRSRMYSKQMA